MHKNVKQGSWYITSLSSGLVAPPLGTHCGCLRTVLHHHYLEL